MGLLIFYFINLRIFLKIIIYFGKGYFNMKNKYVIRMKWINLVLGNVEFIVFFLLWICIGLRWVFRN